MTDGGIMMSKLKKVSDFVFECILSEIGSGLRRKEEYAKRNGLRLNGNFYQKKARYEFMKDWFNSKK